MKQLLQTILLLISICFSFSCKKYLGKNPDMRLATAETIEDCEALLDDNGILNSYYPNELEISSDDIYTSKEILTSLPEYTQKYYSWQETELNPGTWLSLYKIVANANLVLEGLGDVVPKPSELQRYNNVLGNAYFVRGYAFFVLSQLYAQPFGNIDPKEYLGIPLRLTTNINLPSTRSSINNTYKRITQDLFNASLLLAANNKYKTRANKQVAYAAMSRTYLAMGMYDSSKVYAKAALDLNNALLDFNSLEKASFAPIPRFNVEVIFHNQSQYEPIIQPYIGCVDSLLIKEYDDKDLRKDIFFSSNGDGSYSFKGGYEGAGNGSAYLFGGFAVDELYLTLAECLARENKIDSSMLLLNQLLIKRYEAGSFIERSAPNSDEALEIILYERRKELLFRGIRWMDLRRLRNDPNFAIIPKRIIDGTEFELLPNSPRYTLKIPATVINLAGIPQNP